MAACDPGKRKRCPLCGRDGIPDYDAFSLRLTEPDETRRGYPPQQDEERTCLACGVNFVVVLR